MKHTLLPVLVLSLAFAGTIAVAQPTKPFPDVPKDHWAYQAVMELKQKGILIGSPSGTVGAPTLPQTAGEENPEKIQTIQGKLAETENHVLLRIVGISHGAEKGQKKKCASRSAPLNGSIFKVSRWNHNRK